MLAFASALSTDRLMTNNCIALSPRNSPVFMARKGWASINQSYVNLQS